MSKEKHQQKQQQQQQLESINKLPPDELTLHANLITVFLCLCMFLRV